MFLHVYGLFVCLPGGFMFSPGFHVVPFSHVSSLVFHLPPVRKGYDADNRTAGGLNGMTGVQDTYMSSLFSFDGMHMHFLLGIALYACLDGLTAHSTDRRRSPHSKRRGQPLINTAMRLSF